MSPSIAPATGDELAAARPPPEARPPRWAERLLRIPLFWKLLLANVALVTATGTAALRVAGLADTPLFPAALEFAAAIAVGATLASALVVRLALGPVADLAATAHEVREGDWSARAAPSAVADARLEDLRRVFNDMLDTLTEARRTQRELSHRVLLAEERERERIAQELYSGTAQTLAGALVRMRIVARRGEADCAPLDEIAGEVRQALDEIRAVARRLRPPELDELGVRAALEAHGRRLTEEGGPRMEFQGAVPEARLSDPSRLALFRIAQEALSNAARHAGAGLVRARFAPAADGLVTEIVDDGRGFDPESVRRSGAGLGLSGMQERARYAGGELVLASVPGSGTRLRLVLPWSVEVADDRAAPGAGREQRPKSSLPAGLPI